MMCGSETEARRKWPHSWRGVAWRRFMDAGRRGGKLVGVKYEVAEDWG